jgi:hypothetical protein
MYFIYLAKYDSSAKTENCYYSSPFQQQQEKQREEEEEMNILPVPRSAILSIALALTLMALAQRRLGFLLPSEPITISDNNNDSKVEGNATMINKHTDLNYPCHIEHQSSNSNLSVADDDNDSPHGRYCVVKRDINGKIIDAYRAYNRSFERR